MRRIRVWSNVVFIVPLIVAAEWSIWWYVGVLAVSLVLSLLYHYFEETRFKKSDIAFAWALMACNFVLLILGGFRPIMLTVLDVAIASLAIYVFLSQTKQNYNFRHSLYHVLAAGICTLSLWVFHY